MRLFITVFLIFYISTIYSQDKWYTSVELDFIAPNVMEYTYDYGENSIISGELALYGFLLKTYGVQSDYSYFLLKKLSIGLLGGFQIHTRLRYSMLKLGGVIRYFFIDKNHVYAYLQDANNFTLDTRKFKNGNNFRVGLGIPFLRRARFNISANVFFEQNYFKLNGADPLLSYGTDENPRSLTAKSIGISIGVKF